LRTMSSAEWCLRPAMCFIVPSGPTSGHRTLKPHGLNHREHASSIGCAWASGETVRNPTALSAVAAANNWDLSKMVNCDIGILSIAGLSVLMARVP
jgi:hypothetical protein